MTSSPPRPPHEALRRPLGLSRFWIFLTSADLVVKFEKRAIREMRDAELDAWLADFSLESLRTGLSRFERELMAFRVRKLTCDDDEEPSHGLLHKRRRGFHRKCHKKHLKNAQKRWPSVR
jgi:hypothetical protein